MEDFSRNWICIVREIIEGMFSILNLLFNECPRQNCRWVGDRHGVIHTSHKPSANDKWIKEVGYELPRGVGAVDYRQKQNKWGRVYLEEEG